MIKQRTPNDCGICVIAMALNVSYEEVVAVIEQDAMEIIEGRGTGNIRGMDDYVFEKILEKLGLIKDKDYVSRWLSLEYGSVQFAKNMLWGRRCIFDAKSKNVRVSVNGVMWHFLYWNGHQLFDPSNQSTYEWGEVEPVKMWLFNESHG